VSSDTQKAPIPGSGRSILFVHAHPDDETINNGATMARYAAEGARVTLVTCTRGEFGEIIGPELAHLAADREDRLGEHRERELAEAMARLGVADHRFLGAPGEYHDSGMMGTEGNERADCFWRADVDEAAARLAAVIREVRPQVLVTYNESGGYGHPDHIQAHRVALRAVEMLEGGPDAVARVYFNTLPLSAAQSALEAVRKAGEAGGFAFTAIDSLDEIPGVEEDETVTAVVHATEYAPVKAEAMRAHATQISVDAEGAFYALSNDLAMEVLGVEYYRQALGDLPASGAPVRTDLFVGLAG
jgi:N-acetyl-1-D-myo-inositol-2-amino-2-deoxy-alpha-D-glucopyranoside deacetylase